MKFKFQKPSFCTECWKLKLLEQTKSKFSFDITGKYHVDVTAWISAKNRCKQNLLGMDFIENTLNSIDTSAPKIDLKIFPGFAVFRFQTKSYPHNSAFKIVTLEQPLPLAPQSSRDISIRPPTNFFPEGTYLHIKCPKLQKRIRRTSKYAKKSSKLQCFHKKRSKWSHIGRHWDKTKTRIFVIDNIAFVNHLMNSDTNWDQIFHVIENQNPKKTSKLIFTELTKAKEKLKKSEKKRHRDFTNQYEFSSDLKDRRPQFGKNDKGVRPIELPRDQLKGFPRVDQTNLKNIDFSGTEINNEKF